MRIFVLGAGGTGSLLAQLLERQGHTVWCGDRDVERARRFLGKKSTIEVVEANARNLWSIVRAARGANLVINTSPAVYNKIILRAALRLRAHYLDLNSHLTHHPFRPEQFRFHKQFVAKNRTALVCAGAAPGLTNLLAQRGAELLDSVESVHIRLFESTESSDPVSTWSADVAYDEAISRPRVYRNGRFRWPGDSTGAKVPLSSADRRGAGLSRRAGRGLHAALRHAGPRRGRQNRRQRFRALAAMVPPGPAATARRESSASAFPKRLRRSRVARLIRQGTLENARFAAAVLVRGVKDDQPLLVRWDASFPTLYQIRQRGLISTPISYATAHLAAIFVKHFPRDSSGVVGPGGLSSETRRAIIADARSRDFHISLKITRLKKTDEDDEF